eukprot:CAMPEP_0167794024 /NCGR_PEP_ID=MMETSP0111_2-20121227/13570_1 /TAXON_ID=91324 /ORGANISM="Lotharella globosa, Strain CCCM811" /LENGTH=116 /DNA_ID=CAMNT_0007687375 /DNA_START=272 /DNA_END=622 /DNA_ORIENTATION=+
MHPPRQSNNRSGYMLFAFDFLIDRDYKPWLLEVNASPGCSRRRRPADMVNSLQRMFDELVELAIVPLLDDKETPVLGSWEELKTGQMFPRSVQQWKRNKINKKKGKAQQRMRSTVS